VKAARSTRSRRDGEQVQETRDHDEPRVIRPEIDDGAKIARNGARARLVDPDGRAAGRSQQRAA
jgi:hypothetical protein